MPCTWYVSLKPSMSVFQLHGAGIDTAAVQRNSSRRAHAQSSGHLAQEVARAARRRASRFTNTSGPQVSTCTGMSDSESSSSDTELAPRRHLAQPAGEVARPAVERAADLGQPGAGALAQRAATVPARVLERAQLAVVAPHERGPRAARRGARGSRPGSRRGRASTRAATRAARADRARARAKARRRCSAVGWESVTGHVAAPGRSRVRQSVRRSPAEPRAECSRTFASRGIPDRQTCTMSVRFGPSSDPGETECGCVGACSRRLWCSLSRACSGSSSKSGSSGGGGGLGGPTTTAAAADSACKTRDADEPRGRRHAEDDHGHGHRRRRQRGPARPVQGLVGRREGVGRLHELQGRPRLPQGRRQGGRLQAEPDRRQRTRSRPRAATRSRWSARPRCSSRT